MRTKSTVLVSIAFAAIAMQGVFTSCSSEETVNTEKPTGPQTLTLNLKPADTRAAAYTDPGTAAENTINSVTIGIFDSYNNVKTIQEVTTHSTTPTITTSQLAAGDQVLVAVNAKAETFTGAKTVSDFENKTLAIDDALPVSGSGVDPTKLPMFGTGTIALKSGSTTEFEASVDVYHMVAKITLNSLTVNFSATGGYKDAMFTPTEVFMSNVPDVLDFYPAIDMSSYSTFATYKNLCHGEEKGEESNKTNFKAYLGTTATLTGFTAKNAVLSGISGAATSSWGTAEKILFLYTMPNAATDTPTRLVIKGSFDPDGTGEKVAVPVYYPVNINYNSTDGSAADGGNEIKRVYPNKNYIIDVTIQGKGSSSPTDAIADPQTVNATITVKDFTSATQSNVFL